MNWNSILQFLLSLIGQHGGGNPQPIPINNGLNTIFINRGVIESSGIYGSGTLSWDSFSFESLENPSLFIPAGTYRLQWHDSPHLNGETVPMLIAVPGRTEILIHEGNWDTCSEGCILVGSARDGNAIDSSKSTLALLKEKINAVGIENCQITIS